MAAEVGAEWRPEYAEQWTRALEWISQTMLAGAEERVVQQ
jgi:hypothetical protein